MVGLVHITGKRTLQGMYMDQIANAFIFPFIPVGECEPPTQKKMLFTLMHKFIKLSSI